MARTFGLMAGGAAIAALLGTASIHAGSEAARTTFLTVNVPVALPGVSLAPGTYLFELAAPGERLDIVRVSSADRSQVYFTGFTQLVDRPNGLKSDRLVTFGESRPDSPRPITAWYPPNQSMGHKFIYSKSSRQVMDSASR